MSTLYAPLGPCTTLVIQQATLVAAGHSPIQQWDVWDTPAFGRLYRLDGHIMASARDQERCHQALIAPPTRAHGNVREALVLGGGDGGSAWQLLALPTLERVVVAELDEAVVALTRRYLPMICHSAFDEPRLELVIGDARDYLRDLPADTRFDLIVFDLTDPDGMASALYRESFFALCLRHLRPGGMVSLHLASPLHAPLLVQQLHERLRKVFAHICVHHAHIPSYGGCWAFAWATGAATGGSG